MSSSREGSTLLAAPTASLSRWFVLAYGLTAYVLFLGVFAALALWVGGLVLPYSVDIGTGLLTLTGGLPAVLLNILLVAAFGVPHSIMARRGFKRWWTRIIPASVERPTYMIVASLLLVLMMALWQPLTQTIWRAESPVGQVILWALFASGWLGVVASSFMINHFELFGLQQVWTHAHGKRMVDVPFRTPLLYRKVRHPMMFFILIGFWAIPHMTLGHVILAAAFTAYVAIGVVYEERDLVHRFGDDYRRYKRTTPQFLPLPSRHRV